MDVPAGDRVRLVPEQGGDRRLVVAEIGGETGKAMAQHMGRDVDWQITQLGDPPDGSSVLMAPAALVNSITLAGECYPDGARINNANWGTKQCNRLHQLLSTPVWAATMLLPPLLTICSRGCVPTLCSGRFWTSPRSANTHNRERQLAVDFVATSAGGPTFYLGRDMKLTHEGMGITREDYAAFMRCYRPPWTH